jgi:hypothetical protein
MEKCPPSVSALGDLKLSQVTRVLLWLLLPATLGLAITRQSFWIDEGFTAWFASHKAIGSFYSALIGSPGAPGDPQMLFYLFYIWGWVKLFGGSELAFRAANIPFAVLLIGAMSWASVRFLKQPNLWVFSCLSPFFWFYLKEARPYVALMAFSAVAVVALLAYIMYPTEYRRFAPWCCLVALLLACGTHIVGAFLIPSMVVLVAAAARGDVSMRNKLKRDWSQPVLLCSPAFVALATFYVWASTYGVNRGLNRPGLSNLAFVLHEFLGFGGLGPPRNEIRENHNLSVFAPYWPWLLLGALIVSLLGLLFFRTRPPKIVWYLVASLVVGVGIAQLVSVIGHSEVLGRHLSAFFPLFLITLTLAAKHSFSSRRMRFTAIAALNALAVVWGISDARLVFLRKYQKDSYREAASVAAARARLDGGKILWAADPQTANYYGVRVMQGQRSPEIGDGDAGVWPVSGQAVDARNWITDEARAYLERSTTPTILALSKADLFDRNGGWRTLIQQRRPTEIASLNAFMLYEWRPQSATTTMANSDSALSVQQSR